MSASSKPQTVKGTPTDAPADADAEVPPAALQIMAHHGLDPEMVREAAEVEARMQAEYDAGSLGTPPPTDVYVLGQVETALTAVQPDQAALALLWNPAFLGQARKASHATLDVIRKRLRQVGITRESFDEALNSQEKTTKPTQQIGRVDPEPHPEPQGTAALLGELRETAERHAVLPEGAALAIGLWVMHTWTLDAARFTPRLALTSPAKRCGKSTVLELLDLLCSKSLRTANVSAAALYRTVAKWRPTLLVDEADSFLRESEELRGVLNAGYERGMGILRCVRDDHEPEQFACFAAVAIASIGALPGTLADRSITVRMVRKPIGVTIARLDAVARDRLEALRPRLARWAKDAMATLKTAAPSMPERLNDRQRDICGPLVAIADLAGDSWPAEARAALVALCAASEEDAADVRERALAAVWAQYQGGAEFKPLRELVEVMNEDELAGWSTTVRGRPLDTSTLSRWLRSFGVEWRQHRIARPDGEGTDRPRGYFRTDLAPIAERYLATTATPARDTEPQGAKRRDGVTAGATPESHSGNGVTPTGTPAGCHAVTPDSGGGADVRWRVEAMRPQVPAVGAVPFLKVRPGAGGAGRCLSCGDPAAVGSRCRPCIEATNRVIAEVRGDAR